MQNTLERIFEGLEETLRSIVAPTITDPYILSQVSSIAEIIGNLSTRVQWRTDHLLELVTRIRPILELAGSERFPGSPVLAEPAPTAGTAADDLLAARTAHLFALRELQRSLEARPDEAIEAAVRDFLQWQVAHESSLLRTGMFSAPKKKEGSPS
jgi:hypothetical protein